MNPDLRISTVTALLIEQLTAVPLGATVSYGALSDAIGRDVTGPARGTLQSARDIAKREDGAVFVPIRGFGLRRLSPDEAPDIGLASRGHIRRQTARATRDMCRLAEASNGLSPEASRRLNAEIATQGLIAALADDRAVKAVADAGAVPGLPPPDPETTMRRFLDHIGAPPGQRWRDKT